MSCLQWAVPFGVGLGLLLGACDAGSEPLGPRMGLELEPGDNDPDSGSSGGDPEPGDKLFFRADVTPVTSVVPGAPRAFIPAFLDCRDPKPGETGSEPNGQVCTHTLISGCTEPGKYFPDYASCEVVRTQRPFWDRPPTKEPHPNDPRLKDPAYRAELAWVTEQVEACACTCCHDSRIFDGKFGIWDVAGEGVWLDALSDSGLALFAGLADSRALGAYPPADNHGFDRTQTGIPTTDTLRMKTFLNAELARRGVSEEEARAVPAFGGPLVYLMTTQPERCAPGVGVAEDGTIAWDSGIVRYAYVMEQSSANPVVPPNLDLPAGTLWRLDVLASQPALKSPIAYGRTPTGTFQAVPEASPAPQLELGTIYHLVLLQDYGLATVNCEFEFGAVE